MTDTPYERFIERQNRTSDEARADTVEKRHRRGGRTARENLSALTDDTPFTEYGQLAVAAQRSRRTEDELQLETSGDGVLTVIGCVNGHLFDADRAQTALIINDYSVLAGTQGFFHHRKIDRILSLAKRDSLPVIMLTEGGGGRPGDTDVLTSAGGLNVPTFHAWAALSGFVPRITVNHGFCFAGNAALFGAGDIRIATDASYIGMAGPAMIEGGGLGTFAPTEIGPVGDHVKNGGVDILAKDESDAIRYAKQTLSYWQGAVSESEQPPQDPLMQALPQNRRLAYDPRAILSIVLDTDSILELKPDFGRAVLTGLARIKGIPVAVISSDCRHMGGAIDIDASKKMTDLFKLADRWHLPVVSFIDTPGFMVGPDSESQGAPFIMSELFVAGAKLSMPIIGVCLRRAYGLGAMAMAGGSFELPRLMVSWPEGEFGPMGLEGAVRLGFKQELTAVPEGPERDKLFESLLSELYEKGRATEAASLLEFDNVIDPADTRDVISRALLY